LEIVRTHVIILFGNISEFRDPIISVAFQSFHFLCTGNKPIWLLELQEQEGGPRLRLGLIQVENIFFSAIFQRKYIGGYVPFKTAHPCKLLQDVQYSIHEICEVAGSIPQYWCFFGVGTPIVNFTVHLNPSVEFDFTWPYCNTREHYYGSWTILDYVSRSRVILIHEFVNFRIAGFGKLRLLAQLANNVRHFPKQPWFESDILFLQILT